MSVSHGNAWTSGGPVVTDRERSDSEENALDAAREAAEAGDSTTRVSASDHPAALVSGFEHEGYDCELGRVDDTFFGFIRVPAETDRLHLLWELDVPGEFSYGPDEDGWVGFDTSPVERDLSSREAAMALAGLAAQVAERSRSAPP